MNPARLALLMTLALGLSAAGASAEGNKTSPDEEARAALSRGNYPWYDAKADGLNPVKPPIDSVLPSQAPIRTGWNAFSIGDLLIFLILTGALVLLIVLLIWAWNRRMEEMSRPDLPRKGPARAAARTASLPAGLGSGHGDPWAEAKRLRAAGDYSGAIVCLFAHQLLTLDRLRLARLTPGRTARQIVRGVAEAAFRRRVESTLRLFESVYYGHHQPTPEAFESVWAEAEAMEASVSAGKGPL